VAASQFILSLAKGWNDAEREAALSEYRFSREKVGWVQPIFLSWGSMMGFTHPTKLRISRKPQLI